MAKNTAPAEAEETTTESPIEASARAEIAAQIPAEAPKGISEEAIAEKTRLGITRPQAIEILKTQAAHDAQLAADDKKKGKG